MVAPADGKGAVATVNNDVCDSIAQADFGVAIGAGCEGQRDGILHGEGAGESLFNAAGRSLVARGGDGVSENTSFGYGARNYAIGKSDAAGRSAGRPADLQRAAVGRIHCDFREAATQTEFGTALHISRMEM